MTIKGTLGLLLLSLAACGDGTDISEFTYGGGQPGAALAEGGEVRHEYVNLLGMPAMTWLHVYQYTGPAASENAPFAAAPDNGMGTYGLCQDVRQAATAPWPIRPITGATYLELPKVEVTGTGITGTLTVPQMGDWSTQPGGKPSGNSTFRSHDILYGGGPPGNTAFFNASMTTAAMSAPGGEWTLDIGKGDPMTYRMPEAYTTPLGIGGAAPVQITAGQPLEYTWNPPANDFGESGTEHNKDTYFNFTLFIDPTAAFPPQFFCFPSADEPNRMVINQAVVDALPAGGLIVHANLNHYMEAREAAAGEQRRFDIVTIFCNISTFEKQ